MQSIDTYINESILSSTRAGASFYFDKLLCGFKYRLEKFDDCEKQTLIVSQHGSNIILKIPESKIASVLKNINGILIEDKKGKLFIPEAYKFLKCENCEIDLSSWNMCELARHSKSEHNYITFTFFLCKDIDIVGMPEFGPNLLPNIVVKSSINSFCKVPNGSIVHIIPDEKCKYFSDASIFEGSKLNWLELGDAYLHKYDKRYNDRVYDGFGSSLRMCYTNVIDEIVKLNITNTIKVDYGISKAVILDEPTKRYLLR